MVFDIFPRDEILLFWPGLSSAGLRSFQALRKAQRLAVWSNISFHIYKAVERVLVNHILRKTSNYA